MAIACGYFYPLIGGRQTSHIGYHQDDRTEMGALPSIPVHEHFTHHAQLVKTHNAIVSIGEKSFMVYGWSSTNHTDVINKGLLRIKPSTVWQGEILILCLGTHVPYIEPWVKGSVLDEVAAMCVCLHL